MKNKTFLSSSILLAVAALAAAAFYMKPKEDPTKPSAWVIEALTRPDSYSKGPATAKITVVEFLDPECEACRAFHPTVKQLLSEYPDQVRLIYRYMPFHANSLYAASVLEEAREVGKFEEALNVLFEKQPEWADHQNPKPELIAGYLTALGVDPKNLEKESVIAKHRAKIERDHDDGKRVQVSGTPTFFVNGRMVFELGYEPLKAAINRALKEQ